MCVLYIFANFGILFHIFRVFVAKKSRQSFLYLLLNLTVIYDIVLITCKLYRIILKLKCLCGWPSSVWPANIFVSKLDNNHFNEHNNIDNDNTKYPKVPWNYFNPFTPDCALRYRWRYFFKKSLISSLVHWHRKFKFRFFPDIVFFSALQHISGLEL